MSGGTPDYTIVWNNMTGMEANPDSLSGGLYTATVTDANGAQLPARSRWGVDGIEELTALEGSVFPVPVGDVLNVRLATPLMGDARVDVLTFKAVGRHCADASNENSWCLTHAWNAGVCQQISTEEARFLEL